MQSREAAAIGARGESPPVHPGGESRRSVPGGTPRLSGSQRAAVVVAQLDDARAQRVLRCMAESEVVELMSAMAGLPVLSPEEVRDILAEFVEEARAKVLVGQGGVEAARKLLKDRLGAARAEEVLDQLQGGVTGGHSLSFLHRISPGEIVTCLTDEHPQVIATVLSHLSPDHAAHVMAQIDAGLRVDVAHRIATMGAISAEAVGHIAAVLEERLSMILLGGMGSTSNVGGVATMVAILNNSDQSAERQVLSGLDERSPDLAEEIRNQMFVFEDIVRLDDRSMQLALRQVVLRDLAVALKGVPDDVRDRFRSSMSERAANDLMEEIEFLGPTRASAVEAAQRAVVRIVRDLEASGEIVLARGNDELVL